MRELRTRGATAVATVLEAERGTWVSTQGAEGIPGNTTMAWKLTLRVEPAEEAPFHAALKWSFVAAFSPSAGDRLPVLFDPGDHGKLAIDEPPATATRTAGERLAERVIRQRADTGVARLRTEGRDQAADTLQALRDLGLLSDLS